MYIVKILKLKFWKRRISYLLEGTNTKNIRIFFIILEHSNVLFISLFIM